MNFLNPLLPQMQETAWESLLLGKAIWGKQGCTLCLLINTNLPAQAQNFAGENDQKELEEEMKEQSSCQALPLIPTMPRMPDHCHKEKQLLFSSSSSQLMPEAQTHHPGKLGASLHPPISTGRAAIPFLSSSVSSPRTQTCPVGPGHQQQWL